MTKSNRKIKYALTDDHLVFRQGLRMILNQYKELEFVCEAGDGNELLDNLCETPVDIVLLDLTMKGMDGLDTTRIIRQRYPDTKVLILSMRNEEPIVAHAMHLGASGFILKNSDSQMIVKAMHTVMETGHFFNDVVNAALLKRIQDEKETDPAEKRIHDLSERELQVLKLICQEKTSAEIAESIYLSVRTVEGIRKGLMEKLGAKNIVGLVSFAYKNGLVEH